MPAFCYFDIVKVNDEPAMQEYREKVLDTVDRYQGKYVVIGGPFETREGNLSPTFPVIIQFPSLAQAKEWYDSPEYGPLRKKRLDAVESHAVFFQGI